MPEGISAKKLIFNVNKKNSIGPKNNGVILAAFIKFWPKGLIKVFQSILIQRTKILL